MAEPEAFVAFMREMGAQIAGLSTTVGAQGVAKVVKPFDGDGKQFKEWIKNVEKYSRLVGMADDSIKLVAYQSSQGPVSDFFKRHMDVHPRQTWAETKVELARRFAEVVDPQHALLLLRKVKQRPGETVQVYAERLIALGEDAFVGQPDDVRDRQLVGYFIDGLSEDYMKIKVMREDPVNLQNAINVATAEQNLRKRFNLRAGHDFKSERYEKGSQPMQVDHYRNRNRCYICHKPGHYAKQCRTKAHNVSAVDAIKAPSQPNGQKPRTNTRSVCWNCGKVGHFARDCWNRGQKNASGQLNATAPRM